MSGINPPALPNRPPPNRPPTRTVPTNPAPLPPSTPNPSTANNSSATSSAPPLPSHPPPNHPSSNNGAANSAAASSDPAVPKRPPPPLRSNRPPATSNGTPNQQENNPRPTTPPSSASSTTLGGGRSLPTAPVKASTPALTPSPTSPTIPIRRENPNIGIPNGSPKTSHPNGLTRSASVDASSKQTTAMSESPKASSFLNVGTQSSSNLTSVLANASKTTPKDPKRKEEKPKDKPKKGGLLKIFGKRKSQTYTNRVADYLRQMEEDETTMTAGLFSSLAKEIEKMDTWTSKDRVFPDWNDISADYSTLDKEYAGMMDIKKSQAEGFQFEFGRNNTLYPNDESRIEDADKNICYYDQFFSKSDQANYLTEGEEDTAVGACSISFLWDSSVQQLGTDECQETKVILRTKKKTQRFLVPAMESTSKQNIIKHIKILYPELANLKLTRMADGFTHELIPKFCDYEKQTVFTKYKFGVLYVKDKQTEENDMFSNTEMSKDFVEFLEFIGERITLEGWPHFRGGLDVKRNATGLESVYTKFKGFEIMYHVSTLLPFQPDDLQRVERKRHLGNDVVQIMFKEGNTPFDPLTLRTHYNHVFIVVQVAKKEKGKTFYKIAIANKTGVPPYGPYLKYPPVYEKNDEFRDLLITKFLNAERASMYATDFKTKIIRTNKTLLEEISKEFIAKNKEAKPANPSFVVEDIQASGASSTQTTAVVGGNTAVQLPSDEDPKTVRRKSLDGNEPSAQPVTGGNTFGAATFAGATVSRRPPPSRPQMSERSFQSHES
eukprot:TRINITY_DN5987_c0_g2_i1.p1 TRINITY_DN5987_c0_g2~~TRINITY_DN5987_c0_g2_i1.p1  ORF type:complete len:779 (-),score=261.64 TRINITY_DN5987_c0_g2_i1:40-2376(-)